MTVITERKDALPRRSVPRRSVVAVVAALGALLAGPGAQSASAFTAPSAVSVPSSVLTVGATPGARAGAAVAVKVGAAPVIQTATTTAAAKAGTAWLPAAGFYAGFQGANLVMVHGLGFDPATVGTAGLTSVFGLNKPDPSYVPNGDVVATNPGWVNGTTWVNGPVSGPGGHPAKSSNGSYGLTNLSVPFAGPGGSFTHNMAVSAWNTPDGSWNYNTGVYFVARCKAGDSLYQGGGFSATVEKGDSTYPRAQSQSVARSFSCPAGTVFDRIEASPDNAPTAGVSTTWPTNTWYPPGHASRPADVASDPDRAMETRWRCNGVPKTARSALFKETSASYLASPQAVCPKGENVTGLEIWEVTPNDDSAPDVKVGAAELPAPFNDWLTAHPQCTTGACKLDLQRVDPDTGARVSCLSSPELCVNWLNDPLKAQNYRCQYAGVVKPLSECNVYGPTFDVAREVHPISPATGQPVPDAGPYGDPATGEPVPTGEPAPRTPTSPAAPEGCPPPFEFTLGGLGYWITKGTGCALAAAFSPSPQTRADVALVAVNMRRVTPLPELTSAVGLLTPPDGLTATCLQVPLKLPWESSTIMAFDSCGQDAAVVWVRANRGLIAVFVWVTVLSPIAWWAFRDYAPGSKGVA